jgi:hypothetical protein
MMTPMRSSSCIQVKYDISSLLLPDSWSNTTFSTTSSRQIGEPEVLAIPVPWLDVCGETSDEAGAEDSVDVSSENDACAGAGVAISAMCRVADSLSRATHEPARQYRTPVPVRPTMAPKRRVRSSVVKIVSLSLVCVSKSRVLECVCVCVYGSPSQCLSERCKAPPCRAHGCPSQ